MNPFIAEMIGTMLLILLGNGVVANVLLKETKGNSGGWIVITTGWALAVFVGVAVAAPYSGAHLNPAVTIALALAGKFAWSNVILYITAQIIGAFLGSFLVWLFYKDHYKITQDKNLILATFCTAPAIRNFKSNLISEIIGSFVLIFCVFYFTSPEMINTKAPIGLGALGAFPVALVVWVIGLSLGGTTGYAINPARDLGPRLAHALLPIKTKGESDWAYSWVPILGPIIGAFIATITFLQLSAIL